MIMVMLPELTHLSKALQPCIFNYRQINPNRSSFKIYGEFTSKIDLIIHFLVHQIYHKSHVEKLYGIVDTLCLMKSLRQYHTGSL